METIKLPSRYTTVETTATKYSDNMVLISTNGEYVRIMSKDTVIDGIDFEGGPMLTVGSELFGKKIKSIEHCYKLELE